MPVLHLVIELIVLLANTRILLIVRFFLCCCTPICMHMYLYVMSTSYNTYRSFIFIFRGESLWIFFGQVLKLRLNGHFYAGRVPCDCCAVFGCLSSSGRMKMTPTVAILSIHSCVACPFQLGCGTTNTFVTAQTTSEHLIPRSELYEAAAWGSLTDPGRRRSLRLALWLTAMAKSTAMVYSVSESAAFICCLARRPM